MVEEPTNNPLKNYHRHKNNTKNGRRNPNWPKHLLKQEVKWRQSHGNTNEITESKKVSSYFLKKGRVEILIFM